jgi:hypothetical protein
MRRGIKTCKRAPRATRHPAMARGALARRGIPLSHMAPRSRSQPHCGCTVGNSCMHHQPGMKSRSSLDRTPRCCLIGTRRVCARLRNVAVGSDRARETLSLARAFTTPAVPAASVKHIPSPRRLQRWCCPISTRRPMTDAGQTLGQGIPHRSDRPLGRSMLTPAKSLLIPPKFWRPRRTNNCFLDRNAGVVSSHFLHSPWCHYEWRRLRH